MILWTIRHTKPYNPKDVCYGRLDFDVSPTFEEESDKALKALVESGAKPTRLFSSPLIRCTKFADKASKMLGLPVEKSSSTSGHGKVKSSRLSHAQKCTPGQATSADTDSPKARTFTISINAQENFWTHSQTMGSSCASRMQA